MIVKSDVFTNELKDKDQKLEDLSRRVEKYAKYGIISLFSAVLLIVVFLYNINPLSQSNGSTKCCDQSECCKKYLCCEQTVENDSKKENWSWLSVFLPLVWLEWHPMNN